MGVTFSGSNICGYHWNTTPELCARWYKIGAFYPLAINMNSRDNSPQAPYDFDASIKEEIQDAMATRYSLLRYMNTRLFKHSLWSDEIDDGGTFFKPLFFEFPEDDGAYDYMSLNAMLGPSIKLSLQSDTVLRGRNWNFYSPQGVWCDIFNLTLGNETCHNITSQYGKSNYINMTADTAAYLREGHILPFQNASHLIKNGSVLTVSDLQNYPLEVLINPKCSWSGDPAV